MKMLRADEVADMMAVGYRTVMREIVRGNLPATKVGKQYRIDPRDLDAYLARNKK